MKLLNRLQKIYCSKPRSPLVGFIFALPVIIYILLLFVYPFIYNIYLGSQEMDATSFIQGTSSFNGLTNYIKLLSKPYFWRALRNTLIWTTFSLIFQFGFGFILALFFNRDFPGEKILRGLLLIPWFLPLIVSANAFRFFFSSQGLVNGLLLNWGLISAPINWLTNPSLVIWTLIFINIWIGIPFNFVLLHAGLKEIPVELYEAAEVDGANWWQKLIYITISTLKPVIFTVLMLGIVYTVKHFDIVWIATRGGPANSSHLLSTLSYQLAFREYNFGFAAAVSNYMLFIIFIILFILNLLTKIKRGD